MNRLSRIVLLLAVALGLQVPVTSAPALADPIGGVIIIPGAGTDLDPIRLRTSGGCPKPANAYYARMRGHGLPPEGQIITANTKAGVSHGNGFDVYVALIMRDYAKRYNATLDGRYDLTVYCINRLTVQSYGEFTGSLEFTSPTTYQAIGAAKPIGPPPPPREIAGGLVPDDAGPPIAAPAVTGPSSRSATGPPSGGATGQPTSLPGTDSRASSPSQQLSAQHRDLTFRSARWLAVVLAGAFGIALVARQLRRRRNP